MKILVLTPTFPYPLYGGAEIRNYNIIKNLSQNNKITLVSFIGFEEQKKYIPELLKFCQRVEVVLRPKRSYAFRFFRQLVSAMPDLNFYFQSSQMQEKLDSLLSLQQYDVIHVEFSRMAQYIQPIKDRVKLKVLDQHNIEYLIIERALKTLKLSPLWKFAYWLEWKKLKKYEIKLCGYFDKCLTVSQSDKKTLACFLPEKNILVVPNGVDTEFFSPLTKENNNNGKSIVFTGVMDSYSNVDAVLFFYKEIFPKIRAEFPEIKFYIVGKNSLKELDEMKADKHVIITGFVKDIRKYLALATVVIAPLRIGSGTRLKILEALAMAKPVVSTTIGCEGIEVSPDENIVIADNPDKFSEKVIELLKDSSLRQHLGTKGRELIIHKYDWRKIVNFLNTKYVELLSRKKILD